MLFFRQLKAERMASPEFRAFYEQECHICAHTMTLVSRLADMGDAAEKLLEGLGITPDAYQALKDGDRCDPGMVGSLAQALGMDKAAILGHCPRGRTKTQDTLPGEKEGQHDGGQ